MVFPRPSGRAGRGQQMLETLVLEEVGEFGLGAHHLLRVAEPDGAVESLERGFGMVFFELGERAVQSGRTTGALPETGMIKGQLNPRRRIVRVHGDAALRKLDGAPVLFGG